ncbi:OB-fold nucleic acid binding domain-containing protein, partial [Coprococcus eutactus]|uniref:OB-fold nucleic acid binding domain-containing protein n=1 Tax=Coprococcus eutactus TaxID=33043 RepID=UPI0021097AED
MTIENIYRNRTMNEITEGDEAQTLKVAGWVENILDHGGVSFIVLRDMYGVLQVVMRDTSVLDGITKEDCVS